LTLLLLSSPAKAGDDNNKNPVNGLLTPRRRGDPASAPLLDRRIYATAVPLGLMCAIRRAGSGQCAPQCPSLRRPDRPVRPARWYFDG
jgi:hypothetical protein